MTWLSTHLGPTLKMSWGDGRRQADVRDTEDQRGTGTGTGGKQLCRVGVVPLRVSEIGQLTEVRCVLK